MDCALSPIPSVTIFKSVLPLPFPVFCFLIQLIFTIKNLLYIQQYTKPLLCVIQSSNNLEMSIIINMLIQLVGKLNGVNSAKFQTNDWWSRDMT